MAVITQYSPQFVPNAFVNAQQYVYTNGITDYGQRIVALNNSLYPYFFIGDVAPANINGSDWKFCGQCSNNGLFYWLFSGNKVWANFGLGADCSHWTNFCNQSTFVTYPTIHIVHPQLPVRTFSVTHQDGRTQEVSTSPKSK